MRGRRALQYGASRTLSERKKLRYSQGRMILMFRDLERRFPQDRHFLQPRATNRTATVHQASGRATEGAGTIAGADIDALFAALTRLLGSQLNSLGWAN